jgi:hypothetical protein
MPKPVLPSLLDDAVPGPADIAAVLRACPELLKHPALKMLVADADAAGITDAELQAIADSVPHWPSVQAPKTRIREAPLTWAAQRAAMILYGTSTPDRASVPTKRACSDIRAYLLQHRLIDATRTRAAPDGAISDDQIKRAIGRKRGR